MCASHDKDPYPGCLHVWIKEEDAANQEFNAEHQVIENADGFVAPLYYDLFMTEGYGYVLWLGIVICHSNRMYKEERLGSGFSHIRAQEAAVDSKSIGTRSTVNYFMLANRDGKYAFGISTVS